MNYGRQTEAKLQFTLTIYNAKFSWFTEGKLEFKVQTIYFDNLHL
jgi:hypothetical protein